MRTTGSILTGADLTGFNIDSDSAIGTAASGFTDSGCFALFAFDGFAVEIRFALTNTNAITATSGNIPDTTAFTVNAAYRPAAQRSVAWNNGTVGGMAKLNTDGTFVLATASDSIAASSLIIGSIMFFVSSN